MRTANDHHLCTCVLLLKCYCFLQLEANSQRNVSLTIVNAYAEGENAAKIIISTRRMQVEGGRARILGGDERAGGGWWVANVNNVYRTIYLNKYGETLEALKQHVCAEWRIKWKSAHWKSAQTNKYNIVMGNRFSWQPVCHLWLHLFCCVFSSLGAHICAGISRNTDKEIQTLCYRFILIWP